MVLDAVDPCRPTYHYSSGNWMNDVIPYHDGQRLHVFFDHNPRAAAWTRFHWGHAVTQDLVTWSSRPVALSPQPGGPDAEGCWTGTVFCTGDGPAAAYTGITSFDPFTQVQCLARSDDLDVWDQPGEPVIAHPPEGFGGCFRDPFVWRVEDGWRMLVGSTETATEKAAVLVYESADLARWEYGGPFYVARGGELGHMAECPELFELEGRTVLVASCEQTRGLVGDLDDKGRFVADGAATTFDPGDSYAARSFELDGRRVQLAWIRDTRERSEREIAGWSGALSVPRHLQLGPGGGLQVWAVPELAALRREQVHEGELVVGPSRTLVPGATTHAVELMVELAPCPEGRSAIVAGCDPDGEGGVEVMVDWASGQLAGHDIGPLDPDQPFALHVFVDRSVVEVFAAGRVTTLRSYDLADRPRMALWSDAGSAPARVAAWHLDA